MAALFLGFLVNLHCRFCPRGSPHHVMSERSFSSSHASQPTDPPSAQQQHLPQVQCDSAYPLSLNPLQEMFSLQSPSSSIAAVDSGPFPSMTDLDSPICYPDHLAPSDELFLTADFDMPRNLVESQLDGLFTYPLSNVPFLDKLPNPDCAVEVLNGTTGRACTALGSADGLVDSASFVELAHAGKEEQKTERRHQFDASAVDRSAERRRQMRLIQVRRRERGRHIVDTLRLLSGQRAEFPAKDRISALESVVERYELLAKHVKRLRRHHVYRTNQQSETSALQISTSATFSEDQTHTYLRIVNRAVRDEEQLSMGASSKIAMSTLALMRFRAWDA